jgi:hypothetical protein
MMNTRNKRLCIALFAALAVGAIAIPQEASIKWAPKVGDKSKYRMDLDVEGALAVSITSGTILEIKDDGTVVARESVDSVKITFAGEEMDLGALGSAVQTYSANGELIDRKVESEEMNVDTRWAEGLVIIYPEVAVKPGDVWKRTVKADAAKGRVASETSFTYIGEEEVAGVRCWKLKYEFRETQGSRPITTSATVWLEVKDGSLHKGEYVMKNVEFQPGFPMDATAKLVRID